IFSLSEKIENINGQYWTLRAEETDIILVIDITLATMRPDRSWMIRRKDCTGQVSEEFKNGVDDFIKIAKKDPTVVDALSRIPCPCSKCKNYVRKETFWVEKHLYQYGFMEDYINWTIHGEDRWGIIVQHQLSMMKR
ncbi:hypothetical protein CR513_21742, partial [Mucuna pruriens]